MNDLIIGKVSAALKGHWANPDLVRRASALHPLPLLPLPNASCAKRQQLQPQFGQDGSGPLQAWKELPAPLLRSLPGSPEEVGQLSTGLTLACTPDCPLCRAGSLLPSCI